MEVGYTLYNMSSNFSLEIFGLPCEREFPLPESTSWPLTVGVWASFSSLILNILVPTQGLILTLSLLNQFNLCTLWCDASASDFGSQKSTSLL